MNDIKYMKNINNVYINNYININNHINKYNNNHVNKICCCNG